MATRHLSLPRRLAIALLGVMWAFGGTSAYFGLQGIPLLQVMVVCSSVNVVVMSAVIVIFR